MDNHQISLREASRRLGVSQIRVRELIRKGRIQAERIADEGGERWSIADSSLQAYVESRHNGGPVPAVPAPKAGQADLSSLASALENQIGRIKALVGEIVRTQSYLDGLRATQKSLQSELNELRQKLQTTAGTATKPQQQKAQTAQEPKAEKPQPKAEKPQPKAEKEQPKPEKAKPKAAKGAEPKTKTSKQPKAETSEKKKPAKSQQKAPKQTDAPKQGGKSQAARGTKAAKGGAAKKGKGDKEPVKVGRSSTAMSEALRQAGVVEVADRGKKPQQRKKPAKKS